MLLKLKTQKEEERNQKSQVIKNKLFKKKVFQKAKIIMFYISFDGEVNTKDMIKQSLKLGKIVVVPVCKRAKVIKPVRLCEGAKLKKGLYGILEPAIKKPVNLEDLELVIAPGVAFDRECNRLGRGKGYYDYFLKQLSKKTTSLGLAFDFQVLPSLPATSEDVKVGEVVFA